MTKPNINIPTAFAINGTKTDFSQAKITDGFDRLQPDVLPGDNLNKFIDDTYKGLNGVLELYEGCVLYDSTVAYTNTSIVFYINSDDEVEVYRSLINNNLNNPLTDTTAWEKVEMGGGGTSRNIGEIVASTLPLTDAGLHLLDGALIDGYGIYSAFVDYIANIYDASASYFCTEAQWQTSVNTYGVCSKFVYDSVNNTVRLPKITGILEGTTDVTALGDLIEAGLPNITGIIDYPRAGTPSGAFAFGGNRGYTTGGGSGATFDYANFNASRSSSIYGNSSTVQPQTIKCYYYIVIATSTKTDIQVDIDEVVTDLNGKADVDLSNVTDVANIKMAHNAMPSDTFVNLTLGASGSSYTAPADGYFFLNKVAGSDWYYIRIAKEGSYDIYDSDYRTTPLTILFPAKKNDIITVIYNATGTTNTFKFIYAQGSESEAS